MWCDIKVLREYLDFAGLGIMFVDFENFLEFSEFSRSVFKKIQVYWQKCYLLSSSSLILYRSVTG